MMEEINFPTRLAELAYDALYDKMSDVSEDHWAAGWISNNAHVLWDIVCGNTSPDYGMRDVSKADIEELRRLSRECGGWVSEITNGWVSLNAWDVEHTAYEIKRLEERLVSRKKAALCAHEWQPEAFREEYELCYLCYTRRFNTQPTPAGEP